MKLYEGPAKVYVNGRLLAEATRVSLDLNANNSQVVTMVEGLAGKSDGPRTVTGTIETAIPRRGYEVDFFDLVRSGETFDLVYVSGGKRHTCEVWAETAGLANGTQQAAAKSVSIVGKYLGS